ncbi:AAA-ATPase At3g50940-like [Humulus lupulus]|uniref:AAA-ATPase At3g50940-like n=1 Tax=Humulus lupulus TaxID=3486 RepID=UPI002B40EB8E|nr:AAA-ATPase At3g50940-like [Humulus lupulus]XP_062110636.1 AAA-ATPase At3g50940-like [Humulus lupulus]
MYSSAPSILSTYTTFAASAMIARTVVNELQTLSNQLMPRQFQEKLFAKLGGLLCWNLSSQITITIDEYNGLTVNEIYKAADSYLGTRISSSNDNLKASKTPCEDQISVTINKGERIIDQFEEIQLVWEFVCVETQKSSFDFETCNQTTETSERKSFQLKFHKSHNERVVKAYLPYVMERAKAIDVEKKKVKLFSLQGSWCSIDFRHPSTFETLAMDEKLKKELVDDLDRFVKRKEFYKRVGKAWKRGYLLFGPPGTGKSSLIAAMANYLKFDIYDLELTHLNSNSDLRSLLVMTENKSIIVIEDIDCSVQLENRGCGQGSYGQNDSQLTLSGLLNFIDGLWSSCGDERIIVFTTNYKDKLDPALLRPGRMDMHINMSYCTPCGFKTLAFNYLQIKNHPLFGEVEELIKEVEVTPAEVAEELMRSNDADIVLPRLIETLQRKKKMKLDEQVKEKAEEKDSDCKEQSMDVLKGKNKRVGRKRVVRGRKGRLGDVY